MNIILGILLAIVGYFLVAKSDWLLNNFGRIAWFEQHLGTEGGSRLFYKLLGLLLILGGLLLATGLLGGIARGVLTPLFRSAQ